MAVKVAISGFGRIGRNILRAICEAKRTDVEVVAINDLGSAKDNAHLFKYDSVHGAYPGTVSVEGNEMLVGHGGPIKVLILGELDRPGCVFRSGDQIEAQRTLAHRSGLAHQVAIEPDEVRLLTRKV